MYSRAVPMPNDEKESDAPLYDDALDANNVDMFNDFEDEEDVKAI
jgi:hypothetical protein